MDDLDAGARLGNIDHARTAGGLGLLAVLRVSVEIDDRQQSGPDDAGIRIRLNDPRDRGGDIEVGGAGLLDDFGQFA